jgi:integrase
VENAHTESMIRTMAWREAIKKADLKGLRIHDLRHTFATRVGELAYPVQTIQVLLRHSDIRTSIWDLSNSVFRLNSVVLAPAITSREYRRTYNPSR